MAKIVIIGAGLTGISAAYHLEKKGFFDYALFEKNNDIGGLCRSVHQDGFTFDYTGHLLHMSDPYFRDLLGSIVGFEKFNTINRRSWIYSHETYTKYPFQIHLQGLPNEVIVECIEGFVTRPKSKRKPHTFTQWVQQNFGAGFGKHFFFPYQQKIFACNLRQLTASWTGRFVPATSLKQIIRGSLGMDEEPTGYNANFLYPKVGGIFSWVNQLAHQLQNQLLTNFCVESIDMKNKVITFTNGHHEVYDHLITTMPLDQLLGMVKEVPSLSIKRAQKYLLCNSVINFNLGIARPDVSTKHWIYFPENKYPFYRLGFPHNFAESMAPGGHSSLYGEFSHIGKSHAWVNKTLKNALAETKKVLSISDADITTEKIISIPHAYVIYDAWRDKHLPSLLQRLKEQDIHSIGRYGEWKYASMQEAVLDGKKIADMLTVMPAQRAETHTSPIITPPRNHKEINL